MNDQSEVVSWLSGVEAGAAKATPAETCEAMVIAGPKAAYTVLRIRSPIATTPRFKLYPCVLPSGRRGVLKIAAEAGSNRALENEATLLDQFNKEARRIDTGLGAHEHPYQYFNFVPQVEESFLCQAQNGRRINVLSFTVFDGLSEATLEGDAHCLIPLSTLWQDEKSAVRVDPRTAAWIFGKTLKVMAKAHDMGTCIGDASASNILIAPSVHGVIIFDWTKAKKYDFVRQPSDFPAATAAKEIAQAVQAVIEALGGDLQKHYLPPSGQLPDDRFAELLWRLAEGHNVRSAYDEHTTFYELIYSLWPHEFHPYTTFARS